MGVNEQCAVELAQSPCVYEPLGCLVNGQGALLEHNREDDARSLCGLDHGLSTGDGHCHRLLADHVDAALHRVDRDRRMEVVGGGDDDRVDHAAVQQIAMVVEAANAEGLAREQNARAAGLMSQAAVNSISSIRDMLRAWPVPIPPTPTMPKRTRSIACPPC